MSRDAERRTTIREFRENTLAAQYFVRRRKETRCQGPFPLEKLKELVATNRLTRNLHEVSEDSLVWVPASQIWTQIFPQKSITIKRPSAAVTSNAEVHDTYGMPRSESEEQFPVLSPAEAAPDLAEWYYLSGDAQYGPVTAADLRGFVAQGTLQLTDLIWSQRLGEQWQELGQVPEVASGTSGSFGDFSATGQQRGAQSNSASGAIPGMATASLVLGIIGVCIPFLVGSVLAVIFGHLSLSDCARSGNPKKSRQIAIVGIVLGYTMISLITIGVVLYFAVRAGTGAGEE